MRMLLLSLLLALTGSDGGEAQRVFVLGASLNLLQEACPEAEVLQQLPIGTECLVLEAGEGEWLKVRCGEVEGYASAPLLGPEKPSLAKLKAEARNPRRTLAQREESALRAASLAPADTALRKELARLFFARNLEQAAGQKTPALRPFSFSCTLNDPARCLEAATAYEVSGLRARVEVKKNLFVILMGTADALVVYRGRFQFDNKRFRQTGKAPVKGEVLEQDRLPLTPVLEASLLGGIKPSEDVRPAPSLGQFALDGASLALLAALPEEWAVLKLDTEDSIPRTLWEPCGLKRYGLFFSMDIHGRARATMTGAGGLIHTRWISAVSGQDNSLQLTLAETDSGKTTQELFKLPEPGKDIAYLGETPYTHNLRWYPGVDPGPCREGGP